MKLRRKKLEAERIKLRELFSDIDDYISERYLDLEKNQSSPLPMEDAFTMLKAMPMMLTGDDYGEQEESGKEDLDESFGEPCKSAECFPEKVPVPSVSVKSRNPVSLKHSGFSGKRKTEEKCCAPVNLDEFLLKTDKGFMDTVFSFADKKSISDAELQKKANIDRRTFSKLRCGTTKVPSKTTALALAIALELNLDETKDLLSRAGMALSPCYRLDLIVQYFIERNVYNIDVINVALFDHGEQLLGSQTI